MHPAAYRFVAAIVSAGQVPPGPVVELGGRDVNGSIRSLFWAPYVSVDMEPGPGVDIVADAATYAPPQPPACVVCCEVLEHALTAPAIVANAGAMLQPGGLLIVTAAGAGRAPHSAVDGGPLRPGEYYRNVEANDLLCWLAGFVQVRVTTNRAAGDIYATARTPR
jgi:hypothetical protein